MTEKPCKDCLAEGVTGKRVPALDKSGEQVPGGRCVTHERARKKRTKVRAHELRVEDTYGITTQERQAILEMQEGLCFICRHARDDRSKRLAVDHEHNKEGCDHPPDRGCRNCVRCLACTTCNRIILGRYSVEALARAITVLINPPAQRILNNVTSV